MGVRAGQIPIDREALVDRVIRDYRDALRSIVRVAQEAQPLDVSEGRTVVERQVLREVNAVRRTNEAGAFAEIVRLGLGQLGRVR